MFSKTGERFERAVSIMARLRGPGGCPWDRDQTFDSIKPYTVEETYEVLEAIDFNYKDYARIEKQLSSISVADNKDPRQIVIDTQTEAPVAQALTLIVDEAVKARASDIHLHPGEEQDDATEEREPKGPDGDGQPIHGHSPAPAEP